MKVTQEKNAHLHKIMLNFRQTYIHPEIYLWCSSS